MLQGVGDGYPLYTIETAFDNDDEFSDCFLGYEFQAQCVSDMRLRVFSKQEKKALAEEYAQVRKAYEQERGGS